MQSPSIQGGSIVIVAERIPPFYGGGAMVAVRCAHGFASRGEEVYLLTTTRNPEPIPGVNIVNVFLPVWYRKPGWGAIRRAYDPVLLFRLMWTLSSLQPSVVHCVSAKWFSLLTTVAAKWLGIGAVLETSLIGGDDPVTLSKQRLGALKLAMFRLADAIVNMSPGLYDRCLEAGLPDCQCYVIPNSVDRAKFKAPTPEEKSRLRHKLGLDSFEHVFAFVGVLRPRKNAEMTIEIFRRVAASHPNNGLVLVGPTDKDQENRDYASMLKKLIEDYGLKENVLIPGFVNNVHQWMRASDFFLFLPRMEGFGTVYAEAMSAGLPTITQPIEGITDYIFDDGQTGFVIDDVTEGVSIIERLIQNPNEYQAVSEAAETEAEERFSEGIILDSYARVYNKVAMQQET